MKPTHQSQINDWQKQARLYDLATRLLSELSDHLSDSVSCNPSYGCIWFDVYSREDLKILLALNRTKPWTKSPCGSYIAYENQLQVEGFGEVSVRINASSTALPETCKLVEVEVEVPAQPARTEKRTVIRCNEPSPQPVS